MLILISYEMGKLIYTVYIHCHVISSHKLSRCVVQTAIALVENISSKPGYLISNTEFLTNIKKVCQELQRWPCCRHAKYWIDRSDSTEYHTVNYCEMRKEEIRENKKQAERKAAPGNPHAQPLDREDADTGKWEKNV